MRLALRVSATQNRKSHTLSGRHIANSRALYLTEIPIDLKPHETQDDGRRRDAAKGHFVREISLPAPRLHFGGWGA